MGNIALPLIRTVDSDNDKIEMHKHKSKLAVKITSDSLVYGQKFEARSLQIGSKRVFLLLKEGRSLGIVITEKDDIGWRFYYPGFENSLLNTLYWEKK